MDVKAYVYSTSGIIGAISILYLWNSWNKRRIGDRTTTTNDLPKVGAPRARKRIEGTAVICGGSIAGLLAARVCADHFEDVVIVESESWLATEEGRIGRFNQLGEKILEGDHNRARVMQYKTVNGLPVFFLKGLRHICPEADEELVKAGAIIRAAENNIYLDGILQKSSEPYEETSFASRDTLERILRRLMYKPGGRIRWISGTVTGLNKTDSNHVDSVTIRMNEENVEKLIPASLVVDCTGTTQAGIKWVKRLVPAHVSENIDEFYDTYDPKLLYLTLTVTIPVELRSNSPVPQKIYDDGGYIYVFVPVPSKDHRLILINKIEGHQIQFACSSWGETHMPLTFDEMIDFIKSFRSSSPAPSWVPELLERLRDSESADKADFDFKRTPPCAWFHYEKIKFLPSNFVATGDSVMRLNPLYADGCVKAMVGAITLDRILRSIPASGKPVLPEDFSKSFFEIHSERIASLWSRGKSSDYEYDTTVPSKGESLKKDAKLERKLGSSIMQLVTQTITSCLCLLAFR